MIFAQTAPGGAADMAQVSWVAVSPEIVLAVGAALVLLVEVQFRPERRVLGWLSGFILIAASAMSVALWFRVGSLEGGDPAALAPFHQMIILDRFGVFVQVVLFIIALLAIILGWEMFTQLRARAAEALALVLLATAGFAFMISSGHLIMIFLGLEIGSIALYVLAGLGGVRRSDEAAVKYFLLGSFASAIFVYGAALLFASTGTFRLLDIAGFLSNTVIVRPLVLLIGLGLVIVGLAFKVTAAPFHSWSPDVYQGAPAGMTGFLVAVAKIAGFTTILRILFTAFPSMGDRWAPIIAFLSVVSMVVGVVMALLQDDVRRILAYSGVANAGFILSGIVAGAVSIDNVLFYLGIYGLQLVGAFGVVALVMGGSSTGASLADFRGLATRSPVLAGSFAVLLLAIAGLPLTSGFIAKFGVFTEAWQAGYEWLVIVGVIASAAAFAFYLGIIVPMYMQEPETDVELAPSLSAKVVLAGVVVVTIVLGILPNLLMDLTTVALLL